MSLQPPRIASKRKAVAFKENGPPKFRMMLSPNTSATRRRNFFAKKSVTPVKRPALFDILSSPSQANTLSSRLPPQLLTPDSSPSQPLKKQKLIPISSDDLFNDVGAEEGTEQDDEIFVEIEVPLRKRRVDMRQRLLNRSLEGVSGGKRGYHFGDWRTEVGGFYSKSEDIHEMMTSEGKHTMPFSTASLNRSPIVIIGDESGSVRLISTHKSSDTSAFKGYKDFHTPLLEIACHENAVFDLSVTEDDRRLATASGDQTIRIFDLEKQTCLGLLNYHEASVKQVSFNPSNPSMLISSSRDGDVHLWDLRVSGLQSSQGGPPSYRPVKSVYKAHTNTTAPQVTKSVTAAKWLTNSEYRIVTACEANASIKVWDIRNLQYRRNATPEPIQVSGLPPQHNFNPHRNFGITSLNASPDGSRLYALSKDSIVYAYSTSHIDQGPIHAYSHPKLRTASFYVKSALSKDGSLLATGSSDGTILVFPTEERYLDRTIYGQDSIRRGEDDLFTTATGKDLAFGKGAALVRGHEKEVTGVVWSQRNDVVSISDDFTARCWKNGVYGTEAEELRNGGEDEGRRWACGWAETD